MSVLILSSPTDPHAQAVAGHLQSMAVPHVIWRYDQFLQSSRLLYTLSRGSLQQTLQLDEQGQSIDLQELESIWFRRPGAARAGPMPESWVSAMIESECAATIGGVVRATRCLMVNHPGKDDESLYKLWQLESARRLGINVPETIVTNDPAAAREFCQRLSGRVIYKLISERTNFCFPTYEMPAGVPTLQFRPDDDQHLEQVRFAPHLFQEQLEKSYEVRATAIGETIFAARIKSQEGKSKIDWRLDYGVPMEAHELPEPLAKQCVALMRAFGLNYAAFDFVVDHDEKYTFLELNCAGQYMWLEQRTGQKISLELARLLSGKGRPIISADASLSRS